MSYRPYFQHGIIQLQELFTASKSDLTTLKVIQYELGHRDRPKARALKKQVDEQVNLLSTGGTQPTLPPEVPAQPIRYPSVDVAAPTRLIVECAYCKTPNFVSTLAGIVQNLSCSSCKAPYEAHFKYGVMRATFQASSKPAADSFPIKWLIAGIVLLILLALVIK